MESNTILLLILSMSLVTAACRVLPALLLSNRTLPLRLKQFLSFAPVAILSAMLGPSLFINHDKINLSHSNYFLIGAIPTLLVAMKTKNIAVSVVFGVATVAGLRFFLG